MRVWRARLALAIATIAILLATLTPVAGAGGRSGLAGVLAFRGLADALANVLLFVPLGAALGVRRSAGRAMLHGAALSVLIELVQFVVPGRFVSPGDVIMNALGAGAGALLVQRRDAWLRPGGAREALLFFAAVAGAVCVLAWGTFLFRQAVPQERLYGQWTARFGNMEHYQGRVLDARVGGQRIRSGPAPDTDSLRAALLRGDEIEVRVSAGPPPSALAPIFSIYDRRAREVLLIGASGSDVVVRYRMTATRLRLDQPEIRVRGALPEDAAATLVIRYSRRERDHCLHVDGRGGCGLGFTAGRTWALLHHPAPAAALVSGLWLAFLMLPAGYWAGSGLRAVGAAALAAALLVFVPGLAGVLATPPGEFAGAAVGLAAGYLLRRRVQQRVPQRSGRSAGRPRRRRILPGRTDP